jgi:predicted lactoylglutathione lyase
MSKAIYIALPVTDLTASTRFYEVIGCSRNAQFSDDKSSTMNWSETITFQLQVKEYFATYAPHAVADATKSTQVLLTLTCDSREEVDSIVATAAASGGKTGFRDDTDLGWLYNRAFTDPNGHVFEAVWIDMSAMAGDPQPISA